MCYKDSSKTGLGPNANTYTHGAGRMKAGSEPERGNAHVVFSAAKQQGGAAQLCLFQSSLLVFSTGL